ncbi:N-acetylglucosamine-6-phosphate deacetylase [Frankia sp. Cj5]|uniref:N-acetylglucosamine-6-phosphate deacetylase n=1 Tax=Frankia sp. Cj5 TaxID=2880978 RepID=UPI001EF4CFB0|nr:N-acetylglucosamine-6-phosphate deacetylase [Frankia sp. Cj5]
MSMSRCVLAGARVVTPEGVLDPGWVEVDGGRIAAVGAGRPAGRAGQPVVDLGGAWLLPGFIDLHVHGGGGHDVATSAAEMAAAVAFHRAHGTTRTLVSLVTAPADRLAEQLSWAAGLVGRGACADGHVVGAHLEGPFLSAARCGAQAPEHLLAPDRAVFASLVRAAGGALRAITVAPELPAALDIITDAVAGGIVAAVGHTDATYEQAAAAFAAGASLTTHLFNAMRPLHHREPGPVGAALDAGVACELINDGVHVHPSVARMTARDRHRLVLVTDAIDAAGVGDGDYVLGGQAVRVRGGQARLARSGVLAGSTLTMDEAVRRTVIDTGLPVEAAAAAAATNPARVLGLADRCGAIAAGLDADLVVLDAGFRLVRVMAHGVWSQPRGFVPRGSTSPAAADGAPVMD